MRRLTIDQHLPYQDKADRVERNAVTPAKENDTNRNGEADKNQRPSLHRM
jgi:hypothetical protein